MKNTEVSDDLHLLQKLVNDKLDRSAIGLTVKYNGTIELSNGVTIVVKKGKSAKEVIVLVISPRDVRVYREGAKVKREVQEV